MLAGHEKVAVKHKPSKGKTSAHLNGDWGFVLRAAACEGCLHCVKRVVRCAGEKVCFHLGTSGNYTALSFAKWYHDKKPEEKCTDRTAD